MKVHLICDAVFLFLGSKIDCNQTATEEKDGGKGSEEKG